MSKIMVTVFNDKGNFAGNLEVVEGIDFNSLKQILRPHVVSSSEASTIVVRPMRGISINEDGFLSLIKDQLANAEVLEDAGKLETGFGQLKLEAAFTPDENTASPNGQFTASILITEEGTGNVLLSTHYQPIAGSTQKEFADWVIGRLVEDAQGFQSLISQGTEYLVGRIQEFAGQEEPEQVAEAPAKQPEQNRPPRVRVDQAPKLQRPVEQAKKLVPTKQEIGTMLKEASGAGTERFAVSIPIQVLGRDPQYVIIEVDRTNYDRMKSEGIITTIVGILPEAVIQDEMLIIGDSKGYLMKIRQAFDDHGITTLSVTPRAGSAFTSDSGDGTGPVSIFNL